MRDTLTRAGQLLAATVLVALALPAAAEEFTYQGRLLIDGAPVDDVVDLTFSLWDASSSGSQVGSDQTLSGVSVTNGFFTAVLNGGDEFGADAFDGDDRWIEIEVDAEALSPRQKVTATPYAITAHSLAAGAAIAGSGDVLTVTSTSGIGSQAITGVAESTTGRGVQGMATSTSGSTAGVRGEVASNDGNATGVFGLVSSGTGTGTGVKGQNNGTNGYGLWGQGGNGATGVLGQTHSSTRYGVWAYNSGTGVALRAEGNGNLIEAWDLDAVNLRFRVDGSGNVTADGTYTSPAADFAELLPATGTLEPGDVLVVRADGRLGASTRAYEGSVAGVYSTKPAFLGGDVPDGPRDRVPLAVVGIVPVKVTAENGAITPGDLLAASSTRGHAMRADSDAPQGTVIGKALSSHAAGTGTIRMLVILQ